MSSETNLFPTPMPADVALPEPTGDEANPFPDPLNADVVLDEILGFWQDPQPKDRVDLVEVMWRWYAMARVIRAGQSATRPEGAGPNPNAS